jgi:hypothetical protein
MSSNVDGPAAGAERRMRHGDRRQSFWHALAVGGLRPRRRNGRRAADHHRPLVDWHAPQLLLSAMLVLVLCSLDALLTLHLLSRGAIEANPLMALLVYGDARRFALAKLALTGMGVLVLVTVARFRVFRVLRVSTLLHVTGVCYLALVAYEVSLLPVAG